MKYEEPVVWDLSNAGQAERFRLMVETLIQEGAQVTRFAFFHPPSQKKQTQFPPLVIDQLSA